MTIIGDPDENGLHQCPTCKGRGKYSGYIKCPYCEGNEKGKRLICDILLAEGKLKRVCHGSTRHDYFCIYYDYVCQKHEALFWNEIDCICKNGRLYRRNMKCTRCNGQGKLDWIKMIKSGATDKKE